MWLACSAIQPCVDRTSTDAERVTAISYTSPDHNAFAASAGIALEAEYRALGIGDRQFLGATGIAGQRLPCRASMNARSTALMRV
jgi:hypothetical protein